MSIYLLKHFRKSQSRLKKKVNKKKKDLEQTWVENKYKERNL